MDQDAVSTNLPGVVERLRHVAKGVETLEQRAGNILESLLGAVPPTPTNTLSRGPSAPPMGQIEIAMSVLYQIMHGLDTLNERLRAMEIATFGTGGPVLAVNAKSANKGSEIYPERF